MPSPRFFELTSDNYGPVPHPRWQIEIDATLESGEWWDVWAYSRGERALPPPHPFRISSPGPRSDLNITCFNTIVVSERVAASIDTAAHSEIQLIPVRIEGDPDSWQILNPLTIVDCIDYQRSIITDFYPDAFEDVTRAGKPRGILRLTIHPQSIGDNHIFRVKNWTVAVIVSELIKGVLEEEWAIGLRFDPVTE
jgi:hypothetical protein